jgi:hypothetical protein
MQKLVQMTLHNKNLGIVFNKHWLTKSNNKLYKFKIIAKKMKL